MAVIHLSALQEDCSLHFREWGLAARSIVNISEPILILAAKEARSRIQDKVKSAIPAELLACHGLYLFADLRQRDCLDRIVYIGLVNGERHTLAKRMWDHLAKELSSLNPGLGRVDESVAKKEIERLIGSVLPHSKRIEKYCRTHLKGRAMSRADWILLMPVSAPASHIDQAETALIRTAAPTAQEDRSIVNKQKIGRLNHLTSPGISLAVDAVMYWRSQGLGDKAAAEWLRRLDERAAELSVSGPLPE